MPATCRFLEFFRFFRFFSLKLVYFWTKSRKNIYRCFFHSICATELKFGTQNNVRVRQSILKILIFATENHKWFKVVGIKISFEHVDFWAKSLLFRTRHLWNSTTELILVHKPVDLWDITFCTSRFWGFLVLLKPKDFEA